jgi:hypothetical protein
MFRTPLLFLGAFAFGAFSSTTLVAGPIGFSDAFAQLDLTLPDAFVTKFQSNSTGYNSISSTVVNVGQGFDSVYSQQTQEYTGNASSVSAANSVPNAHASSSVTATSSVDGTTTLHFSTSSHADYFGGTGSLYATGNAAVMTFPTDPNFSYAGSLMVAESGYYQVSGSYQLAAARSALPGFFGYAHFDFEVYDTASGNLLDQPVYASVFVDENFPSAYNNPSGNFNHSYYLEANTSYDFSLIVYSTAGMTVDTPILPAQSVPDSGATAALLGTSLLALAACRSTNRRVQA